MTDHYIAALEARAHRLTAERDTARDEVDTLTVVLSAVLAAHQGCTPETCRTMWAIAQVTG